MRLKNHLSTIEKLHGSAPKKRKEKEKRDDKKNN